MKKPLARSEELDQAYEAFKLDPSKEDQFYEALYGFVENHRHSTKDPDEVQEAVIRIWNKLPSFTGKGGAKFSTWAFQVTQNSLQSSRRKDLSRLSREISLEAILEEGGEASLGESPILSQEEVQIVDQALKRLTTRQREVVNLMREGHTEKQVAELLNLGQSTVHEHWEAALEKLRSDRC